MKREREAEEPRELQAEAVEVGGVDGEESVARSAGSTSSGCPLIREGVNPRKKKKEKHTHALAHSSLHRLPSPRFFKCRNN